MVQAEVKKLVKGKNISASMYIVYAFKFVCFTFGCDTKQMYLLYKPTQTTTSFLQSFREGREWVYDTKILFFITDTHTVESVKGGNL